MKDTQDNRLRPALTEKGTTQFYGQKMMTYYEEKSDFDIWSAFKLGNEAAFNYIYRKHMKGLYNYAYQVSRDQDIARDAIHILFIRIRNKRRSLADVQNIKGYLMRAIYRIVLDELEKKKRKFQVIDNCIEEHFPIELSAETKMINFEISEERRVQLEDAMNQLSSRQRQAVLLMYKEDLSYREIAEIMGMEQVKSARKLIYRAISSLKAFFSN
ncbi:RNA polymerase sigma factor [Echinicola soli]|uniref:RNA polymerase sigma factor n=1 Tax=Echinicola soli TaxID=2591634 RepID=A0A514CFZ7_9BACT|nr:RNA polymerase sigma factor [Echinicola soli]QDH78745.1 RNA polymerase sigma factor [Echinicola soli]